jgi:hypothetical protein
MPNRFNYTLIGRDLASEDAESSESSFSLIHPSEDEEMSIGSRVSTPTLGAAPNTTETNLPASLGNPDYSFAPGTPLPPSTWITSFLESSSPFCERFRSVFDRQGSQDAVATFQGGRERYPSLDACANSTQSEDGSRESERSGDFAIDMPDDRYLCATSGEPAMETHPDAHRSSLDMLLRATNAERSDCSTTKKRKADTWKENVDVEKLKFGEFVTFLSLVFWSILFGFYLNSAYRYFAYGESMISTVLLSAVFLHMAVMNLVNLVVGPRLGYEQVMSMISYGFVLCIMWWCTASVKCAHVNYGPNQGWTCHW